MTDSMTVAGDGPFGRLPALPSDGYATHEVMNQATPFTGHNAFTGDRLLGEIARREKIGWADRLLAEGGLVERLTAKNGPLEQLAAVTDSLNRLAPGMEELAPTIEMLRDAVVAMTLVVNPLSTIAERIPLPRPWPLGLFGADDDHDEHGHRNG